MVDPCLFLITDLAVPRPVGDVAVFDFEVENFELNDSAKLLLLIDNDRCYHFQSTVCPVPALPQGYHLLRAMLIMNNECVKSSSAYVEAEFFVGAPQINQGMRNFMFGQPSLCHLAPRGKVQAHGGNVLCDYFIRNCDLSKEGYRVRISVDKQVVTTISEWKSVNIPLAAGKHEVQMVLVNPTGEIQVFPSWNCEVQRVDVA